MTGPDQRVTANFAPDPKCSLVAVRDSVLEPPLSGRSPTSRRNRHAPRLSGVGTLDLSVTCDQSVRVVVAGTLTERLYQDKRSRRRRRTIAVGLGPRTAAVRADTPKTLAVALPKAASLALAHGATDSAHLTLTASNATATTKSSATISKLTARH